MDISMIGKFFEKDKGLLEGLQSGINTAQSGGQDTGDLISQALQSLQENQQKYGEKAMKAEEKARKYSMIGNILGGVGALANTVNMAYQGIKHSRRGLPIGDPAVKFGSSLAGQGEEFRKDAKTYEILGVRDPEKLLRIEQARQDQELHPLKKKQIEASTASSLVSAGRESKAQKLEDKRIESLDFVNKLYVNFPDITQEQVLAAVQMTYPEIYSTKAAQNEFKESYVGSQFDEAGWFGDKEVRKNPELFKFVQQQVAKRVNPLIKDTNTNVGTDINSPVPNFRTAQEARDWGNATGRKQEALDKVKSLGLK